MKQHKNFPVNVSRAQHVVGNLLHAIFVSTDDQNFYD